MANEDKENPSEDNALTKDAGQVPEGRGAHPRVVRILKGYSNAIHGIALKT